MRVHPSLDIAKHESISAADAATPSAALHTDHSSDTERQMSTIDTELGELIKTLYDAALQITDDPEDATLSVLKVLDKWFKAHPHIEADIEAA